MSARLQLCLDRLDFGSLLDIAHVDGLLASANILDIGHVRVLLSHEDGVNFLEGLVLGFNPEDNLCFCQWTRLFDGETSRGNIR